MRDFFAILPRTTREAARLAKRHDTRLEFVPYVTVDVDRPLRHALEVRHDSFRHATLGAGRVLELTSEHVRAALTAGEKTVNPELLTIARGSSGRGHGRAHAGR